MGSFSSYWKNYILHLVIHKLRVYFWLNQMLGDLDFDSLDQCFSALSYSHLGPIVLCCGAVWCVVGFFDSISALCPLEASNTPSPPKF